MNKYFFIFLSFSFFIISCKGINDTDFIIEDKSSLDYDEIIISDGNGNFVSSKKNKTINKLRLKDQNDESKNEGQFNIKILKDSKVLKDHFFGYWGLGSFFSCYEITITKDSILTKYSKNDFFLKKESKINLYK